MHRIHEYITDTKVFLHICDEEIIIIIFNMTNDNKKLAGSLELFHELWTTRMSYKIQ